MKVVAGTKYIKADMRLEILSREGPDSYKVIVYRPAPGDYTIKTMHLTEIRHLTNEGWEKL